MDLMCRHINKIITQRGYKRGDYAEKIIRAHNSRLSNGQRYRVVYQRMREREMSAWYGPIWPHGVVLHRECLTQNKIIFFTMLRQLDSRIHLEYYLLELAFRHCKGLIYMYIHMSQLYPHCHWIYVLQSSVYVIQLDIRCSVFKKTFFFLFRVSASYLTFHCLTRVDTSTFYSYKKRFFLQ